MILKNFLINESIEDKGIFKALFLAGGQCSGKSTTLKKIMSGQISPRIVNIDKFIEYFVGNTGNNIYNTPLHDRSKILTKEQLYLYVNSLLPLIIDGIGFDVGEVKNRKKILENIGYDTGMIMVNVDREIALKRLSIRNAMGGRQVGLESFNRRHDGVEKSKPVYRSMFDFYIEIDNNDGMLTDDVILQSFKKSLSFFTSSVNNDIGNAIIDKMKEQNIKYLVPDIYSETQLKSMISGFM